MDAHIGPWVWTLSFFISTLETKFVFGTEKLIWNGQYILGNGSELSLSWYVLQIWTYMLGKVGKAQELQDVTFVSDDGQQSSAHKVMLTKLNPMKCHY